MTAMLCYFESVDADIPPPPPTHLARAAVVRCGRISLSVARAASSPQRHTWHGQPRHPRNSTCETMAIFFIRVGKCRNNGYKTAKPIILY